MKKKLLAIGTFSTVTTLLIIKPVCSASLTPGNILVNYDETVTEYDLSGNFIQSFNVPNNGGGSTESSRDISVDSQGNIKVYNGTFDPILTTINTQLGTSTNTTFVGWSTVSNLTYGGIATFKDKTFVTDMRTSGNGGADRAQGVIVFENGSVNRFAEDLNPIDLNLGLDGLLYVLSPGGSPSGRMVSVFDPKTLNKIRDLDLTTGDSIGFNSQRRAIAVNNRGELFVATLSGSLFRLDATGTLINSSSISCGRSTCRFADLDINTSGTLLLTTVDGDVLTTNDSFNSTNFIINSNAFGERFSTFVPKPIPEPLTIMGTLVAGGIGTMMKKRKG